MNVLEKVPWISKQEWEYCRDQLFGNDVQKKKKAVEHLYIWKIRCPNLPIAVECTLILMDVHLQGKYDSKLENEKLFTNTMSFESWYSVAIMRFLNLITDSTVGTKSSSSMNDLVKQYDIPEWIVEIRHAVAHSPLLPSLSSLKEAVERCLLWLYESYWRKDVYDDIILNKEDAIGISSLTFQCFEACLLIKKHLQCGCETIESIPAEDRKKISRIYSMKSDEYFDVNLCNWSLEDLYKCMLKKLSRHLKKDTKYGKYLICAILQTDQYLVCPDAIHNNKINHKHFNEWAEIISVLCGSNVCVNFLQGLVDIVISPVEDSWRRECAATYLNEVLKNISLWKRQNTVTQTVGKFNKELTKYERRKKTKYYQTLTLSCIKLNDTDVWKIIDSVLEQPTPLIKIFLLNLINSLDSTLHPSKRNQIFELINIYFGNKMNETSLKETDNDVYTLRNLFQNDSMSGENMQVDSEKIFKEEAEEDSLHQSSNQIKDLWDWSGTSLGILPWKTDFQPWLQMYHTNE